MTHNSLPFYDLFDSLRKSNEFSLGIAEYFAFLKALQGGFGIVEGKFDKAALLHLCRLLWLKPNQSPIILDNYFEQHYPLIATDANINPDHSKALPTSTPDVTTETSNATEVRPTAPVEQSSSKNAAIKLKISVQEQSGGNTLTDTDEKGGEKSRKFLLSNDYLPITQRALKQIWRWIPQTRTVSTNTAVLDMEATVRNFAQKNIWAKLCYQPQSAIINQIVVLTDHDGSMVAFESLCELLIHSFAEVFGTPNDKKSAFSRYYFYNVPQDHLYLNVAHTEPITWQRFMKRYHHQRIAFVIVSDAGAARGSNSSVRVRASIRKLSQLQKITHKIVWLNPMPRHRWQNTSAARIANFVKMFAITDLHELRQAVKFIKGKEVFKID